jgi:hypothetical protein
VPGNRILALLERDASPNAGVQIWNVFRMERQPVLVLPHRRADHTEPRERHFFFVGWILSEKVSSDPLLRFSARFSLMDLPDFLDMFCRGDLSLMGDLSERKP